MNTASRTAREIMALDNAPGGVALGWLGARSGQSAAAGRRLESAPMTVDTSCDLASVTKIMATTTALIRLVSDGSVGLDDPVARYIPEFGAEDKDEVTVTDLLRHRGGLWEWQPVYLSARRPRPALDYVAGLAPRYRRDSERHYSDLGFMLLGRVVEVACGAPFRRAVDELVTGPLGLARTAFGPVDGAVAASAKGDDTERRMIATGQPYPVVADGEFTDWRTTPIVGEVNDGNAFHAFGGVSGHAGLFAPLPDLLRYARTLATYEDHPRLWNPAVVSRFLADGPDAEQCLGFRRYHVDIDGTVVDLYGHPGFVGCAVGFAPRAGLAVGLCANRLMTSSDPVPTDELWRRVRHAAGEAMSGTPLEPRR